MSSHCKRTALFNLRLARLTEKLQAGTLDSDERADLIAILRDNTTDSPCIVKAAETEPLACCGEEVRA